MHAIILADRPGAALAPLTDDTCAALLPVVDTPLLGHAIEGVAAAGVRELSIVVGPFADAVAQFVAGGARWGVHVDLVLASDGETADAVVDRLRRRLAGDLLVLRGDVLRGLDLAEFLARAAAVPGDSVAARAGGQPAGVRLVRAGAGHGLALPGDPEDAGAWDEAGPAVDLADATVTRIESLAAYHRANLDAAAGRIPHLLLPARAVAAGIHLGPRARVAASATRTAPLFVGARSQLKAEVACLGEVVVSRDVVVDRRASLRRAVILPHSYVGELVAVDDAIVSADWLIDAPTGAATPIVDSFLLADLRARRGARRLQRGIDRVLGALLLLASLPLWPLALAAAWWRAPRAPWRRVTLLGNRLRAGDDGRLARVPFVALELAAAAPVLRRLPWLLPVVAGHLRLVGVMPLEPTAVAGAGDPWDRLRDAAPVGLIGPAQLTASIGAPQEECRLVEAYYSRSRTAAGDLALLARGAAALCSRRAWQAPAARPA